MNRTFKSGISVLLLHLINNVINHFGLFILCMLVVLWIILIYEMVFTSGDLEGCIYCLLFLVMLFVTVLLGSIALYMIGV